LNPQTTIRYDLNAKAHVQLEVYSLLGQRIYTLVDEEGVAGSYEVMFDAGALSSGSYFYRLVAAEKQGNIFSQSKKFTIIK
jgi:hypothetical protein